MPSPEPSVAPEAGTPEPSMARGRRRMRALVLFRRLALAVAGLAVFVYGIQLLQASAAAVRPLLELHFGQVAHSPLAALGLGWGASYLVLSGSPVAAAGIGLFDQGFLGPRETFFFLMGSRLGAAFIVIVIGFVAVARGGGREESFSVGVLTFLVTYTVYLPALVLGDFLLGANVLASLTFRTPMTVLDLVDLLFDPWVDATLALFGPSLTFLIALAALYLGLSIFDRAFHRLEVEDLQTSALHRYLQIPGVSFLMGAAITFVSTSVSLSLGMLVPLYLKGYIRRREIIPYIMGANITTFVDTLLVALLVDNVVAVNLVVASMLAVTVVSLLYLAVYQPYHDAMLRTFHALMHRTRNLAAFAVVSLAAPVALLLFG